MTTLSIHPSEADALYDELVPGILRNPYIPHYPHPKQEEFLGAHKRHDYRVEPIFECLYGGAAGGGKSDALLMAAAQYAWLYPHFRGVLIRRTHAELMKAGALISRAMQWWPGQGVAWDGSNKIFRFPNGSTVEMGYHSTEVDNGRYQGGEWHFVGFDELTHWPDSNAFEWLRSRVRKNVSDPIPLRLVAASNPGSVGHTWVKQRFVGGFDIATGQPIAPFSPYIRATIEDNPSLDRNAYIQTLKSLHPTVRDQLLHGDWDAREPGDYYRTEWFGPMLDPETDLFDKKERVAIRWWDLAASIKEDAARTAGVLMSRHRRGVRAVEHATAFRLTPGARDARILQQAQLDGHDVYVGLEIEGGSGGPAQFETLSRMLRSHGFRVVGAKPKAELTDREGKMLIRTPVSDVGKAARAAPVASCLERGHQRRGECPDRGEPWWGSDVGKHPHDQTDGIRIFVGAWTQPYLDELEGFPDVTLKDLADATNGAWAWLEAHPFGMQSGYEQPKEENRTEQHGIHPEDRDEHSVLGDVDYAGRWLP